MNEVIDIGVARNIGAYSDAVVSRAGARWLLTSGTPGLSIDGEVPAGIARQAEQAWQHIVAMLAKAGMALSDIVKVNQYLTDADDIVDYGKVRSEVLGDLRPASLLLVVPALVRPDIVVEIEVYAASDRPCP